MLILIATQLAAADCTRVPSQYSSLADAIRVTPAGGCIDVSQDVGGSQVLIDHALTIRGTGARPPRLPPIRIRASGVTLERVTSACSHWAPSFVVDAGAQATITDATVGADATHLCPSAHPWFVVQGDLLVSSADIALVFDHPSVFDVRPGGALDLRQTDAWPTDQDLVFINVEQGEVVVRGGTVQQGLGFTLGYLLRAIDSHVSFEDGLELNFIAANSAHIYGKNSTIDVDYLISDRASGRIVELEGGSFTAHTTTITAPTASESLFHVSAGASLFLGDLRAHEGRRTLVTATDAAHVGFEDGEVFDWSAATPLIQTVRTPLLLDHLTLRDSTFAGASVVQPTGGPVTMEGLSVTDVRAGALITANDADVQVTSTGLEIDSFVVTDAPFRVAGGDMSFTDTRLSRIEAGLAGLATVDGGSLSFSGLNVDVATGPNGGPLRGGSFTVTGGTLRVEDAMLESDAGGIFGFGGDITLTNIHFPLHSSRDPAVDVAGGSLLIDGFSGHFSPASPTPIRLTDGVTATLRHVVFDGSVSRVAPYLWVRDSTVLVEDSTLSGATISSISPEEVAGGIYASQVDLTLRRTRVDRGSSFFAPIVIEGGRFTATDVTMYGNHASIGSSIYLDRAEALIQDLEVVSARSGSDADADGAVLLARGASVVLDGLVVTDVYAQRGDLVSISGGTSDLRRLDVRAPRSDHGAVVHYAASGLPSEIHTGGDWLIRDAQTARGAIAVDAATAQSARIDLSDIRIRDAHATEGAGAITVRGGDVTVTRLDACGNTGSHAGHAWVEPGPGSAPASSALALRSSQVALTRSDAAIGVRDRGAALTLDHVTAIGADVAVIQLDLGSLALHDTILADAPTAVAGPGSVLSDFTFFWTALGGGPVWDGIVDPAGEQILPVDPWFRAYPGRDAASCDSIDLRLSSRSEARGYGDPSYTNADGTLADVGGTSGPWWPRGDADGDGWDDDADCAPDDPQNGPQTPEIPYDGVDQDCDAADLIDIDNDGWGAGQWGYDCDDLNPEAWPGAPERWYDGVDQSCNGGDDFDADRDGYPTPEDCDDADEATHPGAVDLPEDGVDQDCGGEPESLPTDDVPAVNPVTPWGCATASGSGPLPLCLAIFSLLRRPRQQHRPPRENPKLPARQRSAGRHQEAARRQ